MSSHDELRELIGVYAVGALTPAERQEFEAHVPTCPECQAELQSLGPVLAALAQTVPLINPSAGVRERILTAATGRVSPKAPEIRAAVPPVERSRGGFVAWFATAAAILLAAALGWQNTQLRSRLTVVEARLNDAIVRATAAERQVADAQRTAGEAQTASSILAAPDLARIDLVGQSVAPQARARAFWSRSRGLVFNASDLPALPAGKVYQLWVVTSAAPISAGLLTPDQAGRASATIETPPDIPQPVAMAVTLEPAGGVPAPTGERYLIGALAATL